MSHECPQSGGSARGPIFHARAHGERLLLGLLLAALFFALTMPVSDPDFWWHLASGRWMWEQRALPRSDPFSVPGLEDEHFARNRFSLTHSWGAEVLLFAVHAMKGLKGVILLRAATFTLQFLLLHRFLRVAGAEAPAAAGLLVLAILANVAELGYVGDRPQMWTGLLFLVALLLLERLRGGGRGAALALPPLFLLWANLHGGYLIGIAALVIYAAGALVRRNRARPVLATALASLAAAACNPNGLALLVAYPRLRLGASWAHFQTIREEQPLLRHVSWAELPAAHPALAAVLALFLAAVLLRGRALLRERGELLATALLTLGLGLAAVRFVPLFVLAGVPVIAAALSARGGERRTRPAFRGAGIRAAAALLCALAVGKLGLAARDSFLRKGWTFREPFLGAAHFLQQSGLQGNLFNLYDPGGYLAWRLYPQWRVFAYGRTASPRLLDLYQEVLLAPLRPVSAGEGGPELPQYEQVFRRHGIHVAVLSGADLHTGRILPLSVALARDPSWVLAYADPRALVFLRDIPAHAALISRSAHAKSLVWDNVIAIAQEAAARSAGAGWRHTLAFARHMKGERGAALREVEELLRLDPGDARALALRRSILGGSGTPADAGSPRPGPGTGGD